MNPGKYFGAFEKSSSAAERARDQGAPRDRKRIAAFAWSEETTFLHRTLASALSRTHQGIFATG
jgi:hypothetical protein